MLAGTAPVAAQSCAGDCDGDGSVAVAELVRGVNIALGRLAVDACDALDGNGDEMVRVNELIVAVGNALNGCAAVAEVTFLQPTNGLLVLSDSVRVQVALPPSTQLGSVSVRLDGLDVTAQLDVRGAGAGGVISGNLEGVEARDHALIVTARIGGALVDTGVAFTAIALDHPDECEILNNAECLLPYPSSRFLVETPGATDGNGVHLQIPQVGVPPVNGPPISPAPQNQLDGFSPTVQILMHFPQGVDPQRSDAARLLPPRAAGPPWIDTRTYGDRSLAADSPSVLLDAETGERVLHYIENDAHAADNPSRRTLVLRPAESLVPGHRYIVAMRALRDAEGNSIVAEPAFAALRDGRASDIPALEARRAGMDEIFTTLATHGVARDGLVLAFDFRVQSEHQLTHVMLSMRDQAFAWLDEIEAGVESPFTVEAVEQHDCGEPGSVVWRDVSGTFRSPLFLDGDPDQAGVQFLALADGEPVSNGFIDVVFDISIPCSVFDEFNQPLPLVLGHGLFGTGRDMARNTPERVGAVADWNYIAGATLWRGLSQPDLAWLINDVIGVGTSRLENFPALPDRLKQGMLNMLVLARMMKRGLFNRHEAFQRDGAGVFPGPQSDLYYYGISLGGIMGTWFAALTPDVQRFAVDVPAINFSCLLQRSTQFGQFQALLAGIGLSDPMQTLLGVQLQHELWVASEPAGYARHVTADRLPGSGAASHVLMTAAWLDKQVSNQCTEVAARTLGLPNLLGGSIVQGLQAIADELGPLDSAFVMYDTGSFDLFNPQHEPFIPPLANLIPSNRCDPHSARPRIPAAIRQVIGFLAPGGPVENFCNGFCDAGDPTEWEFGRDAPCDPLQ